MNAKKSAFTLIETLVVVLVMGVLAGILFSVVKGAKARVQTVQCATKMKALGSAMLLYANENSGELPRSWHSAGAHHQPGWAMSIAPYLDVSEEQITNNWSEVFNLYFRSPVDVSENRPHIYSYAMNVHFELDPDSDDYTGYPEVWNRLIQIPKPSRTILLAQTRPVPYGDHLMSHMWSQITAVKNALNHNVHGGKANYLFVDGHIETLKVEATFDRTAKINFWNPSLAK